MIRNVLTVTVGLVCLACLASCSSSPAPRTDTPDFTDTSLTDPFIDWAQLDWKFKRHHLIGAYLFGTLPPRNPFGQYVKAVRHDSPFDKLDLDEFMALDPGDRADRRRAARHHLTKARRFYMTVLRSWQILSEGARFSTPLLGEAITISLHDWVLAANIDPSNPYAWYDLAYFQGLAGNAVAQREALENCLALPGLADLPDGVALRLRAHLDLAWVLKNRGEFEACLEQISAAAAIMKSDTGRTLDTAKEAVLLRGLALAEDGQLSAARHLAKDLRAWPVFLRQPRHLDTGDMMPSENKRALETVESDWAQTWIWALTWMKLGDRHQALAGFSERDTRTEFPPHLNYRYWNDRGRICEHFGEMELARLNYVNAAVYRPYFIYYPMVGARGLSKIYGQRGTGQLYFLGYKQFYLSGSFFSYAANRVIHMEMESNLYNRTRLGDTALDALTICRKRGLRPTSSLALRGRVYYRLGRFAEAEQDLLVAHAELRETDREDPDVLLMLGIINFDRKDYIGAVEWLDKYTRLIPERALGQRLLGVSLAHGGRLDRALEILDYSLELDPDSATGLYNRALVQLKLGHIDAARTDLEAARTLWPENPDILRLMALTQESHLPEIKLTSQMVELRVSEEDSLKFVENSIASTLQLVANSGTGSDLVDAQAQLPDLEAAYARDPGQVNRTRLAWALLQVENYGRVRRVLAPHWDRGLTQEELILLLKADRGDGLTERSEALAVSLGRGGEPVPNAALWELVAAICLENNLAEAGRRALAVAVELDPQNANLRALQQRTGP